MLSSEVPCQNCQHKEICKYREEASAAYSSLDRGSYNVPEHGDRTPGDQNTAMMPYRASKFLMFNVRCRYYKGPGLVESWSDE